MAVRFIVDIIAKEFCRISKCIENFFVRILFSILCCERAWNNFGVRVYDYKEKYKKVLSSIYGDIVRIFVKIKSQLGNEDIDISDDCYNLAYNLKLRFTALTLLLLAFLLFNFNLISPIIILITVLVSVGIVILRAWFLHFDVFARLMELDLILSMYRCISLAIVSQLLLHGPSTSISNNFNNVVHMTNCSFNSVQATLVHYGQQQKLFAETSIKEFASGFKEIENGVKEYTEPVVYAVEYGVTELSNAANAITDFKHQCSNEFGRAMDSCINLDKETCKRQVFWFRFLKVCELYEAPKFFCKKFKSVRICSLIPSMHPLQYAVEELPAKIKEIGKMFVLDLEVKYDNSLNVNMSSQIEIFSDLRSDVEFTVQNAKRIQVVWGFLILFTVTKLGFSNWGKISYFKRHNELKNPKWLTLGKFFNGTMFACWATLVIIPIESLSFLASTTLGNLTMTNSSAESNTMSEFTVNGGVIAKSIAQYFLANVNNQMQNNYTLDLTSCLVEADHGSSIFLYICITVLLIGSYSTYFLDSYVSRANFKIMNLLRVDAEGDKP